METGLLFTKILSTVTVIGNISFVVFFAGYFLRKDLRAFIDAWFTRFVLPFGFIITSFSTVGSLIYSEVVGFPACILCWIQRIFMYPLMFVFALAWWRNDRSVTPYVFMLALIGGLVALYQWVKDMLLVYLGLSVPCPAVASLPSCDKLYVFEYGYVTIPMIALNAFLWVIFLTFVSMRKK